MSSITQSILQFLYDFVHWQYFGILALIWIVVDLVWIGRWRALIERINKLINKPWVFEKDKEPTVPPLYPRRMLEQLALNSRRETRVEHETEPAKQTGPTIVTQLQEWGVQLGGTAFDPKHPLRSLGYVIAFAFFVFFLLADAIVIANTMVLLGLISPDLPPLLQRLDLAILGGALFTAIVGIWMLVEMSGAGELVNAEQLTAAQKQIYKTLSIIVTLFSVAVMIALAVQRLISLGVLDSDPTTQILISFVLYGLLALNNSLSAALTFQSTALGVVVITYLCIEVVIGILPILAFLVDILWRIGYALVDVAMWILLTPIIAIPYGIGKVFNMV